MAWRGLSGNAGALRLTLHTVGLEIFMWGLEIGREKSSVCDLI